MMNATRVSANALRLFALLLTGSALIPVWAENPKVTIMTRNMYAGSDLGCVFAATDEASFVQCMAATLAQIKSSRIPERAALLAEEIKAQKPDLIALQEVTLWRTGPMLEPPATEILYDQLDLLLAELSKRKLHYGIVAIQTLVDAEAPVPTDGIDLRITDRDVILARLDLPQTQFDLTNAQTHRYKAAFVLGSPLLGELVIPRGWMSVDVAAGTAKFRFFATHLESTYPGVPLGESTQVAQAEELLAALNATEMPVVLAGDLNSNADPGPEYTGSAQKIVSAGFADAWRSMHPGELAYTWPLFGDDPASGPTIPNERLDLIFTGGPGRLSFGRDPSVLSAERIGASAPFVSDHAGLVVTLRPR